MPTFAGVLQDNLVAQLAAPAGATEHHRDASREVAEVVVAELVANRQSFCATRASGPALQRRSIRFGRSRRVHYVRPRLWPTATRRHHPVIARNGFRCRT